MSDEEMSLSAPTIAPSSVAASTCPPSPGGLAGQTGHKRSGAERGAEQKGPRAKAAKTTMVCDLCEDARAPSSRFCVTHRRSVNALGDMAARAGKEQKSEFSKVLRSRDIARLRGMVDAMEEKAPGMGRGRPRGSFDFAQLSSSTTVMNTMISEGVYEPKDKADFMEWYALPANGGHSPEQCAAEWARMLDDPTIIQENWHGNTRCYVYTGRKFRAQHGLQSAQHLVEKDKEIKRPKEEQLKEMTSTLGAGLNSNLLAASASAGGAMSTMGASTARILEQHAPQTASMSALTVTYDDLMTPSVGAGPASSASEAPATTPKKSVAAAGDIPSEKKSRWEGRANACLKASEVWEDKLEALRDDMVSVATSARQMLSESTAEQARGVEKWATLLELRLSGCDAWLADSATSIQDAVRKILGRADVKEEPGIDGGTDIAGEDQMDKYRHKLPCTNFDEILPCCKLRPLSQEYDMADSAEDLKQRKVAHMELLDKVRVLINQTRSSAQDLARARANKANKAMREAAKEQQEKLKAARRTEDAAKARAKKRARAGALQSLPIHRCGDSEDRNPMTSYNSPEEFRVALQGGSVSASAPYIVHNCEALTTYGKGDCPHRESLESMLGAFAGSIQERTHGRGVVYLESQRFMDELAVFAPCEILALPPKLLDERNEKRVASIAMFAFSARMSYIGTELLDLPGVRATLSGARFVRACKYTDIAEHIKVVRKLPAANIVSVDEIREFLEDMTDADLNTTLKESPTLFCGTVAGAGSAMFVPAGWIIADCTMSVAIGHGIRRSCVLKSAKSLRLMQDLQSALDHHGVAHILAPLTKHLQESLPKSALESDAGEAEAKAQAPAVDPTIEAEVVAVLGDAGDGGDGDGAGDLGEGQATGAADSKGDSAQDEEGEQQYEGAAADGCAEAPPDPPGAIVAPAKQIT